MIRLAPCGNQGGREAYRWILGQWRRVVSSIARAYFRMLLVPGGSGGGRRGSGCSTDVSEESLFEYWVIFLVGRLMFASVLFQNKKGLKGRMGECVCVRVWLIIYSFGFCTFRLLLLQYVHYGSGRMWYCINFALVWGIWGGMNISFGCDSNVAAIIAY